MPPRSSSVPTPASPDSADAPVQRGALPLDTGANAELVLFWIGHPHPLRIAEALDTFVGARRAEGAQTRDFGLDVVDHDVEVHAVLAGFRLRNALQNERRRISLRRNQHRERRVDEVLA